MPIPIFFIDSTVNIFLSVVNKPAPNHSAKQRQTFRFLLTFHQKFSECMKWNNNKDNVSDIEPAETNGRGFVLKFYGRLAATGGAPERAVAK